VAKLDRWSEDLKFGLEQEIKDLDQQIRDAKRASTTAATLAEKLTHQRTLKNLQGTRNQKRKDLFAAQDEVEGRRDGLISNIEVRLNRNEKLEPIFSIRWRLE
jgi:adenine-specific DNA-methyltransferase